MGTSHSSVRSSSQGQDDEANENTPTATRQSSLDRISVPTEQSPLGLTLQQRMSRRSSGASALFRVQSSSTMSQNNSQRQAQQWADDSGSMHSSSSDAVDAPMLNIENILLQDGQVPGTPESARLLFAAEPWRETPVQQEDHDKPQKRTMSYDSLTSSITSAFMDDGNTAAKEDIVTDFSPPVSRHYEWMGRSIETLTLGYAAGAAPILAMPQHESSADRMESDHRRNSLEFLTTRGSIGSDDPLNDVPLSARPMHGGTLASIFNPSQSRRNDNTLWPLTGANSRRRSMDSTTGMRAGPNICLSLMAREATGRVPSEPSVPATERLRIMGGITLHQSLNKPAGGILSELANLDAAISRGDWSETSSLISALAPRLMGDPTLSPAERAARSSGIDDPSLPASASKFHAGGGRLGFERDAFCLAGGVQVLIRIFREPAFVGYQVVESNDARDLTRDFVLNKSNSWNETLASLRELIIALPTLVHDGTMLQDDEFLPFLFTMLSHDCVFDGAATLIEEILSLQSHTAPPIPAAPTGHEEQIDLILRCMGDIRPSTTFFLGNIPELYSLWRGFNFRQLAHFCRILALLVFEPEDRHLLESTSVLKSVELLQLRRDRAVRAGRDSSVDMNQAILLGDQELLQRTVKLLRVMNYAPSLQQSSAYHLLAHYPFIADTLMMLGLSEMESWRDVGRLEKLARKILVEASEDGERLGLGQIGAVAPMMENLSNLLTSNPSEPATQLGHIIHVINAAQQAGIVVGRDGTRRERRRTEQRSEREAGGLDGLDNFSSAAMTLAEHLVFRTDIDGDSDSEDYSGNGVEDSEVTGVTVEFERGPVREATVHHVHRTSSRSRINNPEDAANELQFNALLLAPYQVEVLFVLCTLLGGRRKIDAQNLFDQYGLIETLDEMFHRLAWSSPSSRRRTVGAGHGESGDHAGDGEDQPRGIHGPGCECTPESALSVQYLRLLHNFCDRDCDNFAARRQLLSGAEREFLFSGQSWHSSENPDLAPGLFSKVAKAFMLEADDSPYRFWLASCAESYLRGSSPQEQVFAARTGLIVHLVNDITSERLHCAGSLQTSFDLLGELCKGNSEVLGLLVSVLDETSFRKLMNSAIMNLVDSNVFLRSLVVTVERIAAGRSLSRLGVTSRLSPTAWTGRSGSDTRFYLTHSWWDVFPVWGEGMAPTKTEASPNEEPNDDARTTDWFPSRLADSAAADRVMSALDQPGDAFNTSVGYNGWIFSPDQVTHSLDDAAYLPNTMERLTWFISTNESRLLRDLLGVVDLRNINHENICCLNTAVVVVMFANRRNELEAILGELRQMIQVEIEASARCHLVGTDGSVGSLVEGISQLDIGSAQPLWERTVQSNSTYGDRSDPLKNFRELLWFWSEYYTHRGRDRLSLEFSSHLRFWEWEKVVSLLTADDRSSTALVRRPVRLPRSPYQRASRILDNSSLRGS